MSNASIQSLVQFTGPSAAVAGFEHVAVAIGEGTLGPCGHVGILYRDDGDVHFLHLAWHYQLEQEEFPEGFGWIKSPLPAELAMVVAARCRRIVRANPGGLPYAPGRHAKLDHRGALALRQGTWGFTCATFVLAVFEHAGIPLVVTSSWPERSDDESFKQHILQMLEKTLEKLRRKLDVYQALGKSSEVNALQARAGNLEVHIEGIRTTVTSARFRPEEVAAASSLEQSPAVFEQVREPARLIVECFAKRAP